MDKADAIYKVITRLFDKYPNLVHDSRKLIWCVWTELGYTEGYEIKFNKFLSAPKTSTILRVRRMVVEDHPLYKINKK